MTSLFAPAALSDTAGAPRVIGLDLSLRATGIAGPGWARTVRSTGRVSDRAGARRTRLRSLLAEILLATGRPDLVLVEGPSYGSQGAGTWDRAGLWWLVVDALHARELPVAIVPPACRAQYATGRGNAPKQDVLDAVRDRYAVDVANDNEADAYVLAAMGRHRLGAPLATVPEQHLRALDGVQWPDFLPEAPATPGRRHRARVDQVG
ncbi:hypothetical protein HUT18_18435 [Streptomyces sp. NA04227]|uniref:hypothetical protein n=1 Tax=Streptomyces sp. NA04227 TaxID=2742136 RepID=UPI00158FE8BA|nr:hypothetical protein [Streptomyces sp. NA04227]QKW08065.1 hypothetical protein HUT18_18435 [Streptomyces sp. NA04227]